MGKLFRKGRVILILLIIILLYAYTVASDPTGAEITVGESYRMFVNSTNSTTNNITIEGGNVTSLNIGLVQVSSIWQGFFGEVSGGIILGDASGDNFYDWNFVQAVGQILATRELVSDWTSINCSNQTQIYFEEEQLNIPNASSDGINDTFTNTTHPDFAIAGRTMSGCRGTLTNSETASHSVFWNVLLSSNSTTMVYTVLLDNDAVGYNGTTTDFQMLVPVDKESNIATYFIYVELE